MQTESPFRPMRKGLRCPFHKQAELRRHGRAYKKSHNPPFLGTMASLPFCPERLSMRNLIKNLIKFYCKYIFYLFLRRPANPALEGSGSKKSVIVEYLFLKSGYRRISPDSGQPLAVFSWMGTVGRRLPSPPARFPAQLCAGRTFPLLLFGGFRVMIIWNKNLE